MTRYRRVETGTWNDAKFRELSRPEPNGQTLWMYLLCGQRTTIFPGLVAATLPVMADDLGWPLEHAPKTIRTAWHEITALEMAEADFSAGVIVLPKALLDSHGEPRETARPHSPNSFRGWSKAWADVPECGLKDRYLVNLGRFAKALGKPYVKAYEESFARHLGRVSNASDLQHEPARVPDPVPVPDRSGPSTPSGSGRSMPPEQGRPRDRQPAPVLTVRPLPHDGGPGAVVASKDARMRQGLVERFRELVAKARSEAAAKHGLAGVRIDIPLHGGENETELRQRLRDSGDRAFADLEHVIAVATAEAMADPEKIAWLGWNLGRSRSWDRALRTTPALAVKPPQGARRSVFDVVDDAVAKLEQITPEGES